MKYKMQPYLKKILNYNQNYIEALHKFTKCLKLSMDGYLDESIENYLKLNNEEKIISLLCVGYIINNGAGNNWQKLYIENIQKQIDIDLSKSKYLHNFPTLINTLNTPNIIDKIETTTIIIFIAFYSKKYYNEKLSKSVTLN